MAGADTHRHTHPGGVFSSRIPAGWEKADGALTMGEIAVVCLIISFYTWIL